MWLYVAYINHVLLWMQYALYYFDLTYRLFIWRHVQTLLHNEKLNKVC